MKIAIDTEVLSKHNLSLGEFLIMLMGFFDVNFNDIYQKILYRNGVSADCLHEAGVVLSDNAKEEVIRILTESDPKLKNCGIEDFEALAKKLQENYPGGIKSGTTYPWIGTVEEIAQKLRYLIVKYDFYYTEEEAINAVKEYVESCKDQKYMALLKYFILRTVKDKNGEKEMKSAFMSIIENNREADENNH